MPGPWERFQQPAEGPWSRFQKPAEVAQAPEDAADPIAATLPEWQQRTRAGMRRIANNPITRQAELGVRGVAEGGMDLVSPFADALGVGLNAVLPGQPFPTNHSQQFSGLLSQTGLPEPQGGYEKFANIASRILTGAAAGGPINKAVMSGIGLPLPAPNAPTGLPPRTASTPAAKTLEAAGVPLDASQRGGGRFSQMLRAAVSNHPITAGRQAAFSVEQQKAFNRAVLRSIGANADEATQEVMSRARDAITSVFDDVGKAGSAFDDPLQTEMASIVDRASRTVIESELQPLLNNVDDILAAVDDSGRLAGEKFVSIRSNLSELSRSPGALGQRAGDLEEALLSSLERSHPGQRVPLQTAIEKYRNLKIIEPAISKGTDANIMPLQLSNAVGSARNRAMSIYGRGGDQELVELAKAGRTVLPQALPDSGTIPRGMMQAPLRAIATAPLYKAAQARLLAQPAMPLPPGYGVRAAAIPAGGTLIARLLAERNQR